jgi:hypothetical protein
MMANTINSTMYTEPYTLSLLLMNSMGVWFLKRIVNPISMTTMRVKASKPAANERPGKAASGKWRSIYPAATKIAVAMTGISASSAHRSPMWGTSISTRNMPSTKPVPNTIRSLNSGITDKNRRHRLDYKIPVIQCLKVLNSKASVASLFSHSLIKALCVLIVRRWQKSLISIGWNEI